MLYFFDRYPLVKLNFFFFFSHICLVLLQNGRKKEMDKLVETTDCWPNLGEKWKSISNINRYLLYQILLRRFLFYYPFMHLWQKHDYAWWRGDRGDRGGNIQGFYLDNRNSRSQNIYLRFGWRQETCRLGWLAGHFPSDLSNYYSDELSGGNWH